MSSHKNTIYDRLALAAIKARHEAGRAEVDAIRAAAEATLARTHAVSLGIIATEAEARAANSLKDQQKERQYGRDSDEEEKEAAYSRSGKQKQSLGWGTVNFIRDADGLFEPISPSAKHTIIRGRDYLVRYEGDRYDNPLSPGKVTPDGGGDYYSPASPSDASARV
jgi:hypothetical protein